jgi:hypothetical protein
MKIDLGCCSDRPVDRDRRVEHPCCKGCNGIQSDKKLSILSVSQWPHPWSYIKGGIQLVFLDYLSCLCFYLFISLFEALPTIFLSFSLIYITLQSYISLLIPCNYQDWAEFGNRKRTHNIPTTVTNNSDKGCLKLRITLRRTPLVRSEVI